MTESILAMKDVRTDSDIVLFAASTATTAGLFLLTPVPERERWLWLNREAHASVRSGIREAAEGRVRYLGSFAKDVDLQID